MSPNSCVGGSGCPCTFFYFWPYLLPALRLCDSALDPSRVHKFHPIYFAPTSFQADPNSLHTRLHRHFHHSRPSLLWQHAHFSVPLLIRPPNLRRVVQS